MTGDPALDRFAAALGDDGIGRLAELGLVLGLFDRADLDVGAYLDRIDSLAAEAAARKLDPIATVGSLFGDDGLVGNADEYYDPRNSLLHEVLDRRLGIPITLSMVAIAVGACLGIDVVGVPFPGHFLIRVRGDGEAALLDPFAGGARISDEELILRLRAATGRIGSLGPRELGRATSRQVLARMAQNLKVIYLRGEDFQRGLAIQERLILINDGGAGGVVDRRDRGLIYARLGRAVEAEADLGQYLDANPTAIDADTVRQVLQQMRERRGPAN